MLLINQLEIRNKESGCEIFSLQSKTSFENFSYPTNLINSNMCGILLLEIKIKNV